jgi:hypothetical protein
VLALARSLIRGGDSWLAVPETILVMALVRGRSFNPSTMRYKSIVY